MRAVVETDGILEITWMWLPNFIAMNVQIKREIEKKLEEQFTERPLTDARLNEAHDLVISLLKEKFPICKGLDQYIDALKYVYLE